MGAFLLLVVSGAWGAGQVDAMLPVERLKSVWGGVRGEA